MKNNFNIEVSFSSSPKMPYEWDKSIKIVNIKIERISSKLLRELMANEGAIKNRAGVMLLSDAKNAIAIKLGEDGTILKRSFLPFDRCLDVCEFACNLREEKIEFIPNGKKVKYSTDLAVEKEMCDYILNSIKKNDEDLSKYLYYLYFEEIEDYSKEKLIKFVKKSHIEKNMKLYNFLIES